MNIEERKKYTTKMKKHEKLGAVKFQKYVFKVEELKFKILKKLFPNFIEMYDKYCDHEMEKELEKAKNDKERERITRKYKFLKMDMRKEFNQEKNRNYHMDKNNPTEIIKYLEWNKSVHQRGIIKDIIMLAIFIAATVFGSILFAPLIVVELLNAGIDLQCINIQDYNLCRLKIMEDYLKKRQEREQKKKIEEYGEASHLIYDCIEKNEQLPTIDEILDQAKNPEQLKQLKNMLLEELKSRNNEKQKTYSL